MTTFEKLITSEDVVGLDDPHSRHLVNRGVADVREFITVEDISAAVTDGVLFSPYLQLVHHSKRLAEQELTRPVTTSSGDTFDRLDAQRVFAALGEGHTLKLNAVDHWHRQTAQQRAALSARYPVDVKAFVFLTPAAEQGLLPHRDGSHVLVVQLEGTKEWTLWNPGVETRSSAGMDVDLDNPAARLRLEPGDTLYLPHGYPHSATAVGGPSLHLTFTITVPTPQAFVSCLPSIADDAPLPGDRGELVRARAVALAEQLRTVDDESWYADALDWQRTLGRSS